MGVGDLLLYKPPKVPTPLGVTSHTPAAPVCRLNGCCLEDRLLDDQRDLGRGGGGVEEHRRGLMGWWAEVNIVQKLLSS